LTWHKTTFRAVSGDELPLSPSAMASLAEGVLAKGAAFRFRAKGNSMHPFIRNHDVLTLIPIGPSGPEVGDVVAVMLPGGDHLLVHRVIAIKQGVCVLKGDGLVSVDGEFSIHLLLGKVVKVHRNHRRIRFGLGLEKKSLAWIGRIRCSPHAFSRLRWYRKNGGAL
jgi:hypothetical protein